MTREGGGGEDRATCLQGVCQLLQNPLEPVRPVPIRPFRVKSLIAVFMVQNQGPKSRLCRQQNASPVLSSAVWGVRNQVEGSSGLGRAEVAVGSYTAEHLEEVSVALRREERE